MKFNILALSATVFLFNQVFAAPADNHADVEVTDNALEADMIQHGWDKKDTQVLTTFLDTIDRLGDIVGQASLGPAGSEALANFQSETQRLMAEAGYEYRQLSDNRRVLTRVSSQSEFNSKADITGFISNLIKSLNDQLAKLQSALEGLKIPVLPGIVKIISGLLEQLAGLLGGGK
ncbi:hypothetical protein BCR42DRAFT_427370 [Absidia repens]|uniref:Hydrophobic surface binding protein A-domain-containing protein n=1 Tax=Absidia repens TaxID=90262 RepID=A0A1X2HZS3_9FUNG|nr:hypothetical protein BCR42DRAFT_427370 [Absidia repens]